MPIGGVVITVRKEDIQQGLDILHNQVGVEVQGADPQGHIIAVLDTETSEEMEQLIDSISENEEILQVGLTYLNTEDEAELMAAGEKVPRPFGFRKPVE